MKRVIITGGSGFVGANLTRRLIADGHQVHLFLRPDHQSWRLVDISGQYQSHFVDLTDSAGLRAAIKLIRPAWIFNLAAYGSNSSQQDLTRMVNTNLLGTIYLLEALRETGVEAFIQAGSSSEYGFKDFAPAETEKLDPNSGYAVTKAAATNFCSYYAKSHDLKVVTLRLYSVYGPFEAPERLIPTLIRVGLTGHWPPLVNPEISRDFVYVDDVVEAFLLAAAKTGPEAGAIFNVGTGRQMTIREVIATARKLLPVTQDPEWHTMTSREWDTSVWRADSANIQRVLGWRPRTAFDEGLAKTLDWSLRLAGHRNG